MKIFAGVRDVASQTLVKKENVSYVSFDFNLVRGKMTEAFQRHRCINFAAGSQGKESSASRLGWRNQNSDRS